MMADMTDRQTDRAAADFISAETRLCCDCVNVGRTAYINTAAVYT
jgi:hypothetical protein